MVSRSRSAGVERPFDVGRSPVLTDEQVTSICRAVEPLAKVSPGDKFVRLVTSLIWRRFPARSIPPSLSGRRKPGRDRVILHLYDLSASKEKTPQI